MAAKMQVSRETEKYNPRKKCSFPNGKEEKHYQQDDGSRNAMGS